VSMSVLVGEGGGKSEVGFYARGLGEEGGFEELTE